MSKSRQRFVTLAFSLSCCAVAGAQPQVVAGGIGTSQSANSQTATTEHTIRGQVINGIDQKPIPRALVTLNARQVLTDSEGHFTFEHFTDPRAQVMAIKPGFSASNDGSFQTQRQQPVTDLDSPVEVLLYPDALITGIVTGHDGLPLSKVQIRLIRALYDGSVLRWMPTGFAMTDSRGEYRITTPAGRFRIGVNYMPATRETGEAVMPVTYPQEPPSDTSGFFTVQSGEERSINLRPKTGTSYPVTLRVDANGNERNNLRFTITTSHGESFFTGFGMGQSPGEFKFMLPSGSFTIQGHSDIRDDAQDGIVSLTVGGAPVSGIVMHLSSEPVYPVELAVDPSVNLQAATTTGSSVSIPDLRQFNLYLRNLEGAGDGIQQDVQLRIQPDKSYQFRIPPGRYRLEANGGGPWHVQSATCGGDSLIANDLVVSAGSGGAPIRLVVSNAVGTVHGRVTLPDGATSAFVYFIPREPSLTRVYPLSVNSTGSMIATEMLAPGSYTAIALDHRLQLDLRDPTFLADVSSGTKDFEVHSGEDVSIDLELAHMKEGSQ